jgi:hypothetical protein
MTITFRTLARCAALATTLALCGCTVVGAALDPVGTAIGAAYEASITPEEVGATPGHYRHFDCPGLARMLPAMDEAYRNNRDSFSQKVRGWHLSSIQQVQREKNCSAPAMASVAAPAAAAPSPTPAANAAPVTDGTPLPQPQFGLTADTVSPTLAQALGLNPARGALVVDPGSSGLKALDVVVEAAGQEIRTVADLQTTTGRMRPGFKVPLRIWRDRAMREVTVVIAAQTAAGQP